jgi:hypothetical protein
VLLVIMALHAELFPSTAPEGSNEVEFTLLLAEPDLPA